MSAVGSAYSHSPKTEDAPVITSGSRIGFPFHFDLLAVIIVFVLSVCLVRPQIEGWAISIAFSNASAISPMAVIRYMFVYSEAQFPRILEVFPMALGALICNGAPIGWGIAYGIILVAKYLGTRWALKGFISRRQSGVLAVLAMVLLPWEGQWRAHDVPMQFSTLFMILAIGGVLRCRDSLTMPLAVLTPLLVLMSLTSYEALIVVSFGIPFLAIFISGLSKWPMVLARTAPLVIAPVSIFLVVSVLFALHSGSRLNGMMNAPTHPYENPADAIRSLYATSLIISPLACVALPLYLFLIGEGSQRSEGIKIIILSSVFSIMLPLAAIPFTLTFAYINDGERVGIPTGFGFFMLCILVCLINRSTLRASVAITLIACTTISAGMNAYASWRPYGEFQRPILKQVKNLIQNEVGRHVIVRDTTNRLGDVFTFQHQDVFREALQVLGVESKLVDLCLVATPGNRFFPEFTKLEFPVSPVPVCQDASPTDIVLDVHWTNRKPQVVRVQ